MLPRENKRSAPTYRAVILTALSVEFQAVREHLEELREDEHPEGSIYEQGRFSSENGTWEVLLVEVGAGNPRAAFETERALQHFKPQVALFVGVAGGLKDVSLGDVVFAPKVYGYESGKARTTFEPRPDVGESSYPLEQRARAEARSGNWLSRIPGAAPTRTPRALAGPIAAGEKVVAETRSEVFRLLRAQYGDALAVEMEGRGFLLATRAHRRVEALVIRGISDCIDDKTEAETAGSQELASRHASAFAFEVLARFTPPEEVPASRSEERGPVWTVPHPRNPNFTGREALLQEIRAHFLSNTSRPKPLALHGLGGVGKTQLAVEYAGRHAHDSPDYSHVLWLRADEPSTLASSYAALTEQLGLPERAATEQRPKIEAVRRWLQRNTGWLLVFDNAERPGELEPYLPPAYKGHVLITSRNPAWGHVARPHFVEVLELGEAVDFIQRRTGQDDEAAASLLAAALGALPLALVQAAAYIEQTGKSLMDYFRLFEQRRKDLLGRPGAPHDYPHTVATTWSLSFEQVQAQAPAAAALLSLCSFLAPGPIPLALLKAGARDLPEPLASTASDELLLDEAIGPLRQYSLAQVHGPYLLFHRLVQGVMRDRLEEAGGSWARAALGLMHRFLRFNAFELSTWSQCAFLLPHAQAAAEHAWEFKTGQELLPGLLEELSHFWQQQAEYALAGQAAAWGLEIIQETPGKNLPDEMRLRHRLGVIELQGGSPEKAAEHLECARKLVQSLPPDDTQQLGMAQLLNDFAQLCIRRGHLQEARANAEQAWALAEPRVESNSSLLGSLSATLSDICQGQGRFDEARAHAQRALAISEAHFGSVHPAVAQNLFNLAEVLEEFGQYEDAREHYERARSITESIYGPEHPSLGQALRSLGNLHHRMGNLSEARACCERALRILEARLGPEHSTVAIALNDLGRVLHTQGELKQASLILERSIALSERSLGPEHFELATGLDNLGRVYEEQGELERAHVSFKRSLAIRERALGPAHPRVATGLNNLAGLLMRTGNFAEARLHLERALAIDERTYGPNHPEVATDLANLATILAAQGEMERGAELIRRALSIHDAQRAPSRFELLACLHALGKFHCVRGEWTMARPHLERALRLLEQDSTEDPRRFELLVLLGSCLRHLEEHEQAVSHLERARALTPENPSPDLLDALQIDLAVAHRELGDGEQARLLLEQARQRAERSGARATLHHIRFEMGRLAVHEGEWGKARSLIEEVWAHREEAKLDRPDTVLCELGRVLVAQQELARARASFEQALKLSEEIRGADSYAVAVNAGHLGRVLFDLGEYPAARQNLERALSIQARLHGPNSPQTAELLRFLAGLKLIQGQLREAEADAGQSLAIYSTSERPSPNELAQLRHILGSIHLKTGALREARTELERALQHQEEARNPEESIRIPILMTLANVCTSQGDYPLAASTFERALKDITGTSSHLLAEKLSIAQQLGHLHKQHGNLQGARTCFERMVEMLDTEPDPAPAKLMRALLNLATILRLLGEVEPALRHLERALALHARHDQHEQELPPGMLPHALALRGELFLAQGRLPEARTSLEQALHHDMSGALPLHRLCHLHNNLGFVLMESGSFKLALLHFDKALAFAGKAHGGAHSEYAISLGNIGTCLARAGKTREALEKYKLALTVLPPEHPTTQEIQRRMDSLRLF